jgi:hypothetical protein
MRAVLYADDMEPITVIDLPQPLADHLVRTGYVNLEIRLPLPLTRCVSIEDVMSLQKRMRVRIRSEILHRHGHKHHMLFTDDEEAALLLRSTLLPGQRRGVDEKLRQEFVRGFMSALNALDF